MKPPFTISNSMLNKVVEISKAIGNLEFQVERNLKLRKENRIKSIHSSLAIEKNSLTVQQITDIIDGKRVLGDPKEIRINVKIILNNCANIFMYNCSIVFISYFG